MNTPLVILTLLITSWLTTDAVAQVRQTPSAARPKAAYHRTATPRSKARSGAYARYDRSNRRDEENLRLAPGLRLNMPSPPTTDYMGRPLKKKPTTTPGATTISAQPTTPPAKTVRRP